MSSVFSPLRIARRVDFPTGPIPKHRTGISGRGAWGGAQQQAQMYLRQHYIQQCVCVCVCVCVREREDAILLKHTS